MSWIKVTHLNTYISYRDQLRLEHSSTTGLWPVLTEYHISPKYCCLIFSKHIIINKKWCNVALVRNDTRREQVARQYIHLWTNWHPTENNPSIPYTIALIINTSSWNTSVYTGTGFITVYNGMSVNTTKSLNKLHFNKILQSANIFQHKKNSSCSLLIYRLVEITNYFCTLKSVDIYSIVKTVG